MAHYSPGIGAELKRHRHGDQQQGTGPPAGGTGIRGAAPAMLDPLPSDSARPGDRATRKTAAPTFRPGNAGARQPAPRSGRDLPKRALMTRFVA